jgi:hypothetical protein
VYGRRTVDVERAEPVTVKCQECDAVLAADSPSLHLELAYDDEWFAYCETCWREFGEPPDSPSAGRAA